MEVAFLNLCHCDPEMVIRVANKLTANPHFTMFLHVDAKEDITPFQGGLKDNKQVFFADNRKKIFWGGFHAIEATFELLRMAVSAEKKFDYFVLLQNLDYPIKSNHYMEEFFEKNKGTEFIRACKIAETKDWHFARKYKIYNQRDDDFYLYRHAKWKKRVHDIWLAIKSITTIGFNGIIKENGNAYPLYYGAAQWAITRECAKYLLTFERTHPKFNRRMRHIQFPDEEYFHTVIHNSSFRTKCSKYDEPEMRWLVNWRNLHYYEYPKEITVFEKKDFEKLIQREELFIRKVRSEISKELLDLIDKETI